MSLGEQFKQLRNEHDFSQPELAERVGIERFYLSKLENDKSIPSNEIFRSFLNAVDLDLKQFLSRFNLIDDRLQLMQIPDVEQWLNQQSQRQASQQRCYLYYCSALIVISVTLFYVGFSKLVFSERSWEYQSPGIVLSGEPIDIFVSYPRYFFKDGLGKNKEMLQRSNPEIVITREYLGVSYARDIEGGRRNFRSTREGFLSSRPINAWLQVLGVFLFVCGIVGFVIERRLFKL